jgi:hypothetical protein
MTVTNHKYVLKTFEWEELEAKIEKVYNIRL